MKCAKGPTYRFCLKFCSGTQGLFEELGRHAKAVGSQECPNCGACKESVEHVCFECAPYGFPGTKFLDYMKQILTLEAIETFNHNSIFNKAVFV